MEKRYRNNKNFKKKIVDDYVPQGNEQALSTPISELGLSEKIVELLTIGGIATAYDLARRRMSQMYKIQNVNKKVCLEVARKLSPIGLNFREEEPVALDNGGDASGANVRSDTQNSANVRSDMQNSAKVGANSNEMPKKGNQNINLNNTNQRDNRLSKGNQTQNNNQKGGVDRNIKGQVQNNNFAQNQRINDNQNRKNDRFQNNKKQSASEFANASREADERLSRMYFGMTMNEILNGKRQRPLPAHEERQVLTPDSIVKFCRKGRWGFKDWKGNVLIQPSYDEAFSFSEGMACVEMNNKLGYINTKNELVIDYIYDSATSFAEGLASVTIDEKSGYIDKEGTVIIPLKYDIATPFFEGKAIISLEKRWGVLDKDGTVFWR